MLFSVMHATLAAFQKAFPNPAWPQLNFVRDVVQRALERFGPVLPVYGDRVLSLNDLENKIVAMHAQLARRLPAEARHIEAVAIAALDAALLPWYRARCAVEYEVKPWCGLTAPLCDAASFRNPSRTVPAKNHYPAVARR